MQNDLLILLAEDHTMVRKGIKLILEFQKIFNPIIHEAEDGNEVISLISNNQYDVIILDLCLPKIDGLTILRKLKNENKNLPIIILSSHNEEKIIMQTLDNGAKGYLLKNSEPEDLIKAVLTVKRGDKYYSNDVAQIIIGAKEIQTKQINFLDHLTKREKEILQLIVKGIKNKDIASKLGVSTRTIEHHRINIRTKLNIETTSGLIKFVLENSYSQSVNIA